MRELRGLRFTCSECGSVNKARKRNVIIHLYDKQPMYNTIEFHCEECQECMVLFGMNEYIEGADYTYWAFERLDYAPEMVVKAYAKIYFKDTLSTQDEDCITYFNRILLDTNSIADIEWGSK